MRFKHLDEVAAAVKACNVLAILTGAGVSAESGVPTFRGAEGLWAKYQPEELASVEGFLRDPELVWRWYQYRRDIIQKVKPNPSHYALKNLETHVASYSLTTQNVDGLHQRAGSEVVHELHGNIMKTCCLSCKVEVENVQYVEDQEVPKCSCSGFLRPGVVWFGEMLPLKALSAASKAAESADVYLSVGTSALVYPAAGLPHIAKQNGAVLIEINPEPTPLTETADYFLQGKSGELLPRLVEALV